MIEAYIIYLPDSKKSSASAARVEDSLNDTITYVDVNLHPGVDRYTVWQKYIDSGLRAKDIAKFGGGHIDAELAVFYSHYSLWEKCVELDRNILILEHDALFNSEAKEITWRNTINSNVLSSFDGHILNLGAPNWSFKPWSPLGWLRHWDGKGIKKRAVCDKYHIPDVPDGETPCYCDTNLLYGAHAYLITPEGAKRLLASARGGILPADIFIRQSVVTIHDYLPHPAKQVNEFTLIQRYATTKGQKINAWDY